LGPPQYPLAVPTEDGRAQSRGHWCVTYANAKLVAGGWWEWELELELELGETGIKPG
jgi:hypothetical protein